VNALVEAMAGSVLDAIGGEEPSIARLRGLPWSYGCKEVCEFLAGVGVNLQPEAVTMLHNAAGEAFVTLPTPALLHEVLQANHQQIGRRYVEVFASNASEKEAACERNRATMRDDAGYRGVLRMRGLPFTATVEDIMGFFQNPSTLQLSNVHLMRKADGRASGDAYAVFDTEEAAVEALSFDKQKLGARWCTPTPRPPAPPPPQPHLPLPVRSDPRSPPPYPLSHQGRPLPVE
jgi:heterogeneous nuclear ribonucleoprotein F/H